MVWGAFSGGFADPRKADGARLIALPMREEAALAELTDEVVPDGALDRLRVKIFGVPLELSAYVEILRSLGVGGYRDETLGHAGAVDYGEGHFTCFQFDYDWRRDIVENAGRLQAFIAAKRAYVQAELAKRTGVAEPEVRFDLVAHSMGGLVARYYVMYGAADLPRDGTPLPLTWAGAKDIERAVLIGTPNAGSLDALLDLTQGFQGGLLQPTYPPAILGTMPSVYQLLPHPSAAAVVDAEDPRRPLDLFDPALWEQAGLGLASPAQARVLTRLLPDVTDAAARRRVALAHQRACLRRAQRFHEALDREAAPPRGLSLYLFAGDAIPTDAVASISRRDGTVRVVGRSLGDGLVTRRSALLDQRVGSRWSPLLVSPIRWTSVTFLSTDHIGLTKDPVFTDNVLFLLLEQPRRMAEER